MPCRGTFLALSVCPDTWHSFSQEHHTVHCQVVIFKQIYSRLQIVQSLKTQAMVVGTFSFSDAKQLKPNQTVCVQFPVIVQYPVLHSVHPGNG